MHEHIAAKVRKLREVYGYSQRQVGQMINVGQSTYNGKERGQVAYTIVEMVIIAKLFKISLDDLVSDKELTIEIKVSNSVEQFTIKYL